MFVSGAVATIVTFSSLSLIAFAIRSTAGIFTACFVGAGSLLPMLPRPSRPWISTIGAME